MQLRQPRKLMHTYANLTIQLISLIQRVGLVIWSQVSMVGAARVTSPCLPCEPSRRGRVSASNPLAGLSHC